MTTLGERIRQLASKSGPQVAIYLQRAGQPDLPITYSELVRSSQAFAQQYRARGIRPGEVIVLIRQHGPELLYAFWGAALHGAIPSIMPFLTEKLAPEHYAKDLAALIDVTRPAAIVTYPEFEGNVRSAIPNNSSVRAVISGPDGDSADRATSTEDGGPDANPDHVALLQHSSGTTGLQKGVALSHRAILNQLNAYTRVLGLQASDVVVSWLPLYHDMGLIAGFLLPILSGIPLVLASPFDWVRAPWRLLTAVSTYRGTLSWLPNFAYNFCAQKVRDASLHGIDLSTWRAVINCSEPIRWESHRAFFERFQQYGLRMSALQTSYAMAENVFGVTQSDVTTQPTVIEVDREAFVKEGVARPASAGMSSMKSMSSGFPLPNTELRILDEAGKVLPEGHMGEISLRSDCMLTGYYHRPDADRQAFRDGWYLTGDYGYLWAGELFVSGRKKDLIIVGGRNIYPQDLEAISYEVAGVHPGRSVAFGVFNEEAGTEDVYMVVEVETEDELERAQTADRVREQVTRNSNVALRHVKVVGPGWILKTSSGKTARAANRQKLLRELEGLAN
jgi:fatty-acyl-CoA synthase